MRVLVLGEGKSDLGYWQGDQWQDGAIPAFVRKILGEGDEWALTCRQWTHLRHHVKGSNPHGFRRRMQMWMQCAQHQGFDAIVAVVDRDARPGEERLEEIAKGRDAARSELGIDGAVGLAIEKIEAWLLADVKALHDAKSDKSIPRQPDPETLASRAKDSPSNPKYRLRCLIDDGDQPEETYTAVYAKIAAAADLDVVANRCSQGFKPFREDVERLRHSQQTDSIG